MKIDRRTLLIGAGAGAGLAVAYAWWPREAEPSLRADKGATLLGPGILIAGGGRVTVALPQVETGQAIWTGLAQVAADELGAAWETVGIAPALGTGQWSNGLAEEEGWLEDIGSWRRWRLGDAITRITAGSTSMRAMAEPMRRIAAAARALLIGEAAERWDVAAAECDTAGGFVRHEGKSLPFAALAEAAARRPLPEQAPIRRGNGALIGKSLPRLDAVPKANGSLRFAGDVRLPSMLFASLRTGGAARIDSPAPAGVRFVSGDGWVAAVAADWWAAEQALAQATVKIFGPAGGDDAAIAESLDQAISFGEAEIFHALGDVEAAFEGYRPLAASYSAEAALHLDLEPPSATARFTDGLLEVWTATQAPELARRAAAEAGGTGLGETILYAMPVGGQGGRALEAELVSIAVQLAQRLGKPIQVTLSRTEQVRSDPVRAPLRARMLARQAPDGSLLAWKMRLAGGDGTGAAMRRLFGAERGGFRPRAFAPLPYDMPNLAMEAIAADLPIRLGYHRGELLGPLTFFTESFFDELARIGGRDPLSLRMALLAGNPRLARCLVRATALGGWDGGGPGSQMGLAVLSAYGSHIAVVASAALNPNGGITVSRLVAAVDCGTAINPALIQQQIEGGLIAGMAQATARAPSFRHGRVLGPNQPQVPTLATSPEILVEILPSAEPVGGVNGLGPAIVSAAVGNALAAATGRRLRSLPFDPMT